MLHEAVSLAAEAVLLAAACRLLDARHGPQQAAAHALPLLLAPAHPGRLANHLMYVCQLGHLCWARTEAVDHVIVAGCLPRLFIGLGVRCFQQQPIYM